MITCNYKFTKIQFPTGEPHIRLDMPVSRYAGSAVIDWKFEHISELVDLMLLCSALSERQIPLQTLYIPYMPFSRQDRVATNGDAFSLKAIANVINNLNFKQVATVDPHSDVTPALFNNLKVIPQSEIAAQYIPKNTPIMLISPDAGASKKIYKLLPLHSESSVIECSKLRDPISGRITGTLVPCEDLKRRDCYIVDDICDGGGTFVAIAQKLKEKNCGKIILIVSHGFFTKGLSVFDNLIDEVYTKDGRVK